MDYKEALQVAIEYLQEHGTYLGYGAPPSKNMNPTDFTPDFEMCSEKEINAWKDACEKHNNGEKVDVPTHFFQSDGNGNIMHVAWEPWGIGTYKESDERAMQAVAVLTRYL